jgi:hypothetical protein
MEKIEESEPHFYFGSTDLALAQSWLLQSLLQFHMKGTLSLGLLRTIFRPIRWWDREFRICVKGIKLP